MNDVIEKEPAFTKRVELYDFSITEEMRLYSWSTQGDFSISLFNILQIRLKRTAIKMRWARYITHGGKSYLNKILFFDFVISDTF